MLGQQHAAAEAHMASTCNGYLHLFHTHIDVVTVGLEQRMLFGLR
jgi:hypothetical protein